MPRPNPKCLTKSSIIGEIPAACADEMAAVEFMERQRWGGKPVCPHCQSEIVYQMTDAATAGRSKRFLWRCRECKKQFTVRVGTVFEDSRVGLRHWCYAFWRASTSKKGVSALEIKRDLQISYKTALFMLNRIRFAMAPDHASAPKLDGTVEADETYVGGKPRPSHGTKGVRGRGGAKIPVFAVVQRGGDVRVRVVADVTSNTLRGALNECVNRDAHLMTDDFVSYKSIGKEYDSHETVTHSHGIYARGHIHTNTIEGFFSILKRGITGIYHCVSKEHLPRYLSEFEFRYNGRFLSDGERLQLAIQRSEGKRLMYRSPCVCKKVSHWRPFELQ